MEKTDKDFCIFAFGGFISLIVSSFLIFNAFILLYNGERGIYILAGSGGFLFWLLGIGYFIGMWQD